MNYDASTWQGAVDVIKAQAMFLDRIVRETRNGGGSTQHVPELEAQAAALWATLARSGAIR